MEKEEEKCCGACCFMCYEDTEGWGQCVKQDIADSLDSIKESLDGIAEDIENLKDEQ